MAAKKNASAEAELAPAEASAEEAEELVEYGPYELVDECNALSFGADPRVTIEAGALYMTNEPAIAAFLDEHESVRKAG